MKGFNYKDLFIETIIDMWAGDMDISLESFVDEIRKYISNLESLIGKDSHRYLEAVGVKDLTGETWEEQDNHTKQQIKAYKKILEELKRVGFCYLKEDKK